MSNKFHVFMGLSECNIVGGDALWEDTFDNLLVQELSNNQCDFYPYDDCLNSIDNPSISSQLGTLDPDKIYQNEDEEIYIHVSEMCYDPMEKEYFILINLDEGDLRPLYYRQRMGNSTWLSGES